MIIWTFEKSGAELECFVEDKGSQCWLELSGFYFNKSNNKYIFSYVNGMLYEKDRNKWKQKW